MKNLKVSILNMPAWKACICILFILFGLSVIFEVVLSHTIFHVFDRMIANFEKIDQGDKEDLDDIAKSEQAEYCDEYKRLQEEKEFEAKQEAINPSDTFNRRFYIAHEDEINRAIQHHFFNLRKCQEELQRQKA